MAAKLASMKEKAFDQAAKDLDDEIAKPTPDSAAVVSLSKIVNSKAESLVEALTKQAEEHATKDEELEFLAVEKKISEIQIKVDVADVKAFNFLKAAPVAVDSKANLPQLKLQEFSGDVRQWLKFWASFKDIHESKTIQDAEKFQYLLQCVPVNSVARRCIDSFPVCSKNYANAVNALTNTFGRDKMLVKVYVRDLLQMVIRNANEKTRMDVMDLVPTLSSQIRNLEELGVTSDKCEMVLYPVVESCLPEDVLQAWQRNPKFEENLEAILKFLTTEVQNKMERTLAKMDFTGNQSSVGSAQKKGKNTLKPEPEEIPTASGFMATSAKEDKNKKNDKRVKQCGFCEDTRHQSHQCNKAKLEMTLKERQDIVQQKRMCYVCLEIGHSSRFCKAKVICSLCKRKHYEMMCSPKTNEDPKTTQMMVPMQVPSGFNEYGIAQPNSGFSSTSVENGNGASWSIPQQQQPLQKNMENVKGSFANVSSRKSVALMTTLVAMETPSGPLLCRVFIDTGSEESYVESRVAALGKCRLVDRQSYQHQIFGGRVTEKQDHDVFQITLWHVNGHTRGTFLFNSIPKIADKIKKPTLGPWVNEVRSKGVVLIDQSQATEEVQLLIGLDVASQIWTGGFLRINPGFCAHETIFGWVVGGVQVGQVEKPDAVKKSHMVTSFLVSNLNEEDLWSLEMLGITDESRSETRKDLEEAAADHFTRTVIRLEDGRYEVKFPWLDGHKTISSNKPQALARLNGVTRKLKNDGVLDAYHKIMCDWEKEGIIEKVTQQQLSELEYFLPHRHVIKENSTTPVRPVFDASAKGRDGPSLNDCLEKGPNLLELIPAIMSRFRWAQFGAVADIKKAFLQMSVNEEDRKMLQFLWWKDASCKEVQVYRHQRVVFGVKSSPFLLAATLQYHLLNDHGGQEEVAKKLLNSFYVDNSVSSHDTLEEAMEFRGKATALLVPARFDLRGWELGPSNETKIVPVLGMDWETKSDVLMLSLDGTLKKPDGPSTKRGIASAMNAVFDPMGFVFPFTIKAKLLFQKYCELALKWDEELPAGVATEFKKWKDQVAALSSIKIQRWMSQMDGNISYSLHVFSDASLSAFSACTFLRSENEDGKVAVALIMCRTRVAPSKTKLTIPRLELMGCLIGVRLVKDVKKYLGIQDMATIFWTDSSTALAWIQHDKPWARFVAGRVEEIRKGSNTEDWKHVPGTLNPADLPSRGCNVQQLIQCQWWEGPAWLRLPEDKWPMSTVQPEENIVMAELKKTVTTFVAQKKEDVLARITKYSSYHKCLRVVSLVLRYITKLKDRVIRKKESKLEILTLKKSLEIVQESTAAEIQKAEEEILLFIQRSSFVGDHDPQLKSFTVFKDERGLLRTRTQLFFGSEEYETRCPVIIPGKNVIVKALILAEHEVNSHAGTQTTLAIMRNRFWILKGRRAVSGVVGACVTCRRFLARKCDIPGAPLPADRVKDTVAFDITGVDLMGPLFLRGNEKVWIVLYTCAVYRCVHLEITSTLSTEGFLRTLRRFVARRGRPSRIYSDNGLNFVGCSNLFRQLEWEEVRRYSAVQRIEWIFNPPTAAWWGGFWERLVGLTKRLLRRILGKRVVDLEELGTMICDVEATLNKRPLNYISEKDGELEPLCPEFFMRDNPACGLPEADVVDGESLKVQVKRCQQLREELRSRFRKEYLGQLQHHAGTKNKAVGVGDVVLIEYDDKKRVEWPLGVVKEVYPGRDGKCRTALVKTRSGEFLRPIQRLYLLEMCASSIEKEDSVAGKEESVAEKTSRFGRKLVQSDRLKY